MTLQNSARYDKTTIALHWYTAVLVLTLWIIGQTADWIPKGSIDSGYWSIHVVLGFAIMLLLIMRILWRSFRGIRLPPADRGLLQVLAKSTHYLFYILLIAVVGLGVVNAFVRGYNLFGLISLPQIGDRAMRKPITQWHGLIANILLGLAFFHACAALVHHYLWRDGILKRMLPRKQYSK